MTWQLNDAAWVPFGYGHYRARVVAIIGAGETALVRLFHCHGIETLIGARSDNQGRQAVRIGRYVPGWFGRWKFIPCAGVGEDKS